MGAMVQEMKFVQKNQTWELVKLSAGNRVIGDKWMYMKKPPISAKERENFKSCLVAKGYA